MSETLLALAGGFLIGPGRFAREAAARAAYPACNACRRNRSSGWPRRSILRAPTTATAKTGAAPVPAPVRHRGVADSGSAAVAALARHIHQAPPASAPPTPPLHSEPPTMRITAVDLVCRLLL